MIRILFIIPKIASGFFEHFESLSQRWVSWNHHKRDLMQHRRRAKRVFYGSGAITMAAMLNTQDFSIQVIDENHETLDLDRKVDLVAITGQLIQTARIKELQEIFRIKGIATVVGGPQATLYEDEFMAEGSSVIAGEGEEAFLEFIEDFQQGNPKPLYQKQSSRLTHYISPIPRYDLVAKYNYTLMGVQTTRGCPYRCEYCNVANILGDKYRHKGIDQVLEEIKTVKKYWPNSMFYFLDDNLFADKNYAQELFEKIEKQVVLGKYGTHADLSIHKNSNLLPLLTKVGDPLLAFGFETLSVDNAQYIKNPIKTDLIPHYQEIVKKLHNYGIGITGSFMFGFKKESLQEVTQVMEFVRDHPINAYFTIYSVTPKSKLFSNLAKEYKCEYGEFKAKGFEKTKLLNRYLMHKNKTAPHTTEQLILKALKKTLYPQSIDFPRLEGLAVMRYYMSLGML